MVFQHLNGKDLLDVEKRKGAGVSAISSMAGNSLGAVQTLLEGSAWQERDGLKL